MSYEFKLVTLKPKLVAYVVGTGTPDDYDKLYLECLSKAMPHVNEAGANFVGTQFVRLLQDSDEGIEMWVGQEIDRRIASGGDVIVDELPGGKAITTFQYGGGAPRRQVYEALARELDDSPFVADGAPWELIHVPMEWEVDDDDETTWFRREVFQPVKKG